MNLIKIDMNHPEFQEDFFELEKPEQLALIKTLKKMPFSCSVLTTWGNI